MYAYCEPWMADKYVCMFCAADSLFVYGDFCVI